MGFVDFIANLLRDPRAAIAGWIAAGPVTAYGFVFLIIFVETGVGTGARQRPLMAAASRP